MFNRSITASSNRFLKALPVNEFNYLKGTLERVELSRGEMIYQSGEPIPDVYFPETCLVSMITSFDDGDSIESGSTGCEGIVGAYLALSNSTSNCSAIVQVSGQAIKMKAERFRQGLREHQIFNQLAQKYIFAFTEQVIRVGACNGKHSLDKRLSRILLQLEDCYSGQLEVTHESLAAILGVHRPCLSRLAVKYKREDLIDYYRGKLVVTNRQRLELKACECYQVIKEIFSSYNLIIEKRISALEEKPNHQIKHLRETGQLFI